MGGAFFNPVCIFQPLPKLRYPLRHALLFCSEFFFFGWCGTAYLVPQVLAVVNQFIHFTLALLPVGV
jgi:hypothetical protein